MSGFWGPQRSGIGGRIGFRKFAGPQSVGPIPWQENVQKPVKMVKKVKKSKGINVAVRSEFPETWIWTEEKLEYVALVL